MAGYAVGLSAFGIHDVPAFVRAGLRFSPALTRVATRLVGDGVRAVCTVWWPLVPFALHLGVLVLVAPLAIAGGQAVSAWGGSVEVRVLAGALTMSALTGVLTGGGADGGRLAHDVVKSAVGAILGN